MSDSLGSDSLFQAAAIYGGKDDSLRAALRPFGLDLVTSEGTAYVEPNTDSVAAHLGRFLTRGMREFLRLRAEDEAQGFSEDAGLTITWDALSERVAKWERFVQAHADISTDEPRYWYETYLSVYLTGMDNSPIFDFDSGAIGAHVRRSYERFARQYPTTKAGQLVVRYLAALAVDGYKDGPTGRAFIEHSGVKSMAAVQPPVR